MYAPERHQQILATARADGRVDVNRLAEDLDVTPETIRRDLTVLERHGLVRRVHGGAIPVERLGFEPGVADRETRFAGEKERVAKAALEELPDGGAVILDAGTTTVRLAELLPSDQPVALEHREVAADGLGGDVEVLGQPVHVDPAVGASRGEDLLVPLGCVHIDSVVLRAGPDTGVHFVQSAPHHTAMSSDTDIFGGNQMLVRAMRLVRRP